MSKAGQNNIKKGIKKTKIEAEKKTLNKAKSKIKNFIRIKTKTNSKTGLKALMLIKL
jgi:hypothetical protein